MRIGEQIAEGIRLHQGASKKEARLQAIEVLRQVGSAGVAVKKPHHPFDEDQIRRLRSSVQALRAVVLAVHPQVQLVHRGTAGQLVPVRVQEIRPALEHPHPPTLARVKTRQGRGDGGLALARGRGSDQDRWATGWGDHSSSSLPLSKTKCRPLRGGCDDTQCRRVGVIHPFTVAPTSPQGMPRDPPWHRCVPTRSSCRPRCPGAPRA